MSPAYRRLVIRHAITMAAKHFPLLDRAAARRQAKSLIRAKAYVATMPIKPWTPGPTVLV